MTGDELSRWKKLSWVWCKTCGGGSIKKIGWSHKKVHPDTVSLKTAGKLEEAQREFLFIIRGGEAARRVVAEQKQETEAGNFATPVVAEVEYKIDFGTYKSTIGTTLPPVFANEDEVCCDA